MEAGVTWLFHVNFSLSREEWLKEGKTEQGGQSGKDHRFKVIGPNSIVWDS